MRTTRRSADFRSQLSLDEVSGSGTSDLSSLSALLAPSIAVRSSQGVTISNMASSQAGLPLSGVKVIEVRIMHFGGAAEAEASRCSLPVWPPGPTQAVRAL